MSTGGKVLQFPNRMKAGVTNSSDSEIIETEETQEVVDLGAKRQATIQDERRTVRRTILREFVGVHIVVPGRGLVRCALADISERGLAFDLLKPIGHLKEGEEVAMRIYLNHQTYFGFTVKIRGTRFLDDEGVYRHGVAFVEETLNEEAIRYFALFLESVSASLRRDGGDVMVSNLNQD